MKNSSTKSRLKPVDPYSENLLDEVYDLTCSIIGYKARRLSIIKRLRDRGISWDEIAKAAGYKDKHAARGSFNRKGIR